MQYVSRSIFGTTALALLVSASTAWAQQSPPVRVRGTIEKVDGNTLTVKSRAGETLTVKLAEPMRVSAMVKASLADIKEGSFIGVSAMPQPDGTQKAYRHSHLHGLAARASWPTGFPDGTAGPAAP